METKQVDGNNVIAVYDAVKEISNSIRKSPKPVLLECLTFRMRGHEEASGTKYVPKELFEEWGKKDPVDAFERYLQKEKVLTDDIKNSFRADIIKQIEAGLQKAYSEDDIVPDEKREIEDLFEAYNTTTTISVDGARSEKRIVDALKDGLYQSMEKYDQLVLMGQDIAEYGGVFKVTEGFVEKFGKDRVRNTPLCESAIVGTALGLSINGFKAVMEMQFADFVTCGFNQIINNLAKIHWRWGQHADVVVRMPTGAGVAAGPFHSQSNEAWFTHTPGLKVVYPAFPEDAKGLLAAAIEDPNPVLVFEHKALYRSVKGQVPDDYYTIEIGKAKLLKEGNDVSIITYGQGVHWALDTINELNNISCDLIDLRSLMPFDEEMIISSVKKTGKAIVLHEDTLVGGIGGELTAFITENCFEYLDAPVARSASIDTPVPFAPQLEQEFLPGNRFKENLIQLLDY
jgi:2-oxoisovalerate dehydrogenase E1 component